MLRHKKGDVCEKTGRVFWAYGRGYTDGEYWVSQDQYARMEQKRLARLTPETVAKLRSLERARRKSPEHRAKAAAYSKLRRQDPKVKQRTRELLAAKPKVEKRFKMGDIHPDTGMVFWAVGKAFKGGEYWLSPEAFKQRRDRANELRKIRLSDPDKRAERNRKQRERYLRNDDLRKKRNDARLVYMLKWMERPGNKEKFVAARKVRMKKYFQTRPLMKLARGVRTRIGNSIRKHGFTKRDRTTQFLGCDWPTFASHIEAQFKEGMTWDNYGEWEVDHIFPVSRAVSEEHLRGILHYTNTQPLWREENRAKKNKIPENAPPHLLSMARVLS